MESNIDHITELKRNKKRFFRELDSEDSKGKSFNLFYIYLRSLPPS